MPDTQEDLRNAEAKPDPSLTFGYNELLSELAAEFKTLPDMQPGDVTIEDVMNATGLSHAHCHALLEKKVLKGELIMLRVKNKAGGGYRNAYRKVTR